MPNGQFNSNCELSDRQLAEAAQRNDVQAFETLVRRHQDALICFLKFYSPVNQEIEDVAQEAFLKCFLNIHQFDVHRSFRTWLYTIARRSFPQSRRSPKRQCAKTLNLPLPDHLVGGENEPIEHAQQIESQTGLWKAVRKATSDKEFQLVWLFYAEGLGMKDIAEILDDTQTACKMRLSRIRKRLRRHLSPFLDRKSSPRPATFCGPLNTLPIPKRAA